MSEADSNTVIARITKNSREQIVVALTQFQGHQLVDARTFGNYQSEDGESWRPTKKGIAAKIGLLPQIIAALQDAEAEAVRRGLLPGKEAA